jgi:hypothetical protein
MDAREEHIFSIMNYVWKMQDLSLRLPVLTNEGVPKHLVRQQQLKLTAEQTLKNVSSSCSAM